MKKNVKQFLIVGGVGVFLIFLVFLGFQFNVLQSIVGINPSKDTVYFRSGVEGNTVNFNIEFLNNNPVSGPGMDEFESASFVFSDAGVSVQEWTAWVSSIYSYQYGYCNSNHNIRLKSHCCQASGYADNYFDRPGAPGGGSAESCFIIKSVTANLKSLSVGSSDIILTKGSNSWTSNDLAGIINQYCLVNSVNDKCVVPVSLVNTVADGSGVGIKLDYVLKPKADITPPVLNITTPPINESNVSGCDLSTCQPQENVSGIGGFILDIFGGNVEPSNNVSGVVPCDSGVCQPQKKSSGIPSVFWYILGIVVVFFGVIIIIFAKKRKK